MSQTELMLYLLQVGIHVGEGMIQHFYKHPHIIIFLPPSPLPRAKCLFSLQTNQHWETPVLFTCSLKHVQVL